MIIFLLYLSHSHIQPNYFTYSKRTNESISFLLLLSLFVLFLILNSFEIDYIDFKLKTALNSFVLYIF